MHPTVARLVVTVAAALAAGLSAAEAAAENAAADILPGDRLHGNIVTPGDADALRVYLPAGTLLSVDLRPEKGSALLPSLEVLDPDGTALPLEGHAKPGPGGAGVKVANLPVGDTGGTFTLRVLAGEGTSGTYLLRAKAKAPARLARTVEVPAAGSAEATFDAMAGSTLAYAVAPASGSALAPAVDGLASPTGGAVGGADGLRGKKIPLLLDGTYRLTVRDAGTSGGTASVTFAVKAPKPSGRDLFLSPEGFGEAPRVLGVAPNRVLDDRPAENVAVTGEGFDPAASVRLERKGEAPLLPSAMEVASGTAITADFDVTGVRPGAWTLVVENPSGGRGTAKVTVQKAGTVKLPDGAAAGTEVWWLEFDATDFPSDLSAMGLGSTSSSVAALARAAVERYALHFVRRAFDLPGADGRVREGDVPISFVLKQPPAQVGAPGTTYNRLRIGGVAAFDDPSSNPSYPWGDGPLDPGNANFDDVSRDAGPGRGVMARALAPSATSGTDGWKAAMQPLQAAPLGAGDAIYFAANFAPADEAQGARYRDLTRALQAAGREIGGTIAHFIGRAMGIADTTSGISSVPAQPGGYLALVDPRFSAPELAALAAAAKTAGLPGTAKTLLATPLPMRETRPYLLPNATSTVAYDQQIRIAGGRPDRDDDDLQFEGVAGSIPGSFTISATGRISGTAPLFVPGQGRTLNAGVFRFLLRARDKRTGEETLFSHRINLLVKADDPTLSPAEKLAAENLNADILATR